MDELLGFHPLTFDLAGMSPRDYDSPVLAPAEANVAAIDGVAYFACQQVLERADPTEDLSDRERFGIARIAAPDQIETWWIEPDFEIVKTAASDAKRQGFVRAVTRQHIALDIGLTAWAPDNAGWGFQIDRWVFDVGARRWSHGHAGAGDPIPQTRLVATDGMWQFGDVSGYPLETWWQQNDDRLGDEYSLLHPIVAVPIDGALAVWARAVCETDCYKLGGDKFVSALFVIKARGDGG